MSTVHVFETPGDVSLQVRLPSGRVVVTTADEPTTTVEIVGRRGQDAVDEIDVTMDERRGEHVIRIEQKDRFRWGPIQITWGGDFECRITCPHGANLDLSGGSTDVKVDGELGEVSVRTASGDVRLDTVRAELQVKTASGNVWLDAAEADASVATVSGNVELGRVAGSLTARTVSGSFKLGAVASGARSVHDVGRRRGRLGRQRGRPRAERLGGRADRDRTRHARLGRCNLASPERSSPSSGSRITRVVATRRTGSCPCT